MTSGMRVTPVHAPLPGIALLYQDAEKIRQSVLFIWSIWFVWFVWFVWLHETNQMDQRDQITSQTGLGLASRKGVFGLSTPNTW